MASTKHRRITQEGKIKIEATGQGRVKQQRVMPTKAGGFRQLIIRGRYNLANPYGQQEKSTDDPQDEQKLRAMIDRALENVELIRLRMANDQIEIDALRIETRATLAQILA